MSVSKRKNKWYCRFQINGERHHYLCDGATSKQQAEQIEASLKFKIMQQQNGVIPKEAEKLKLSALYEEYIKYAQLNKKTWKIDVKRLEIVKQFWKNIKYAEDIKPNHIEELKKSLLKRNLTKTTVNRYLEILSKMFNVGIDNEWLIKNPIKKKTKFPIKNYQIRYLKDDEEQRLYKYSSKVLRDIIFVDLNTGLREANIRLLQGKNINLEFKIFELTENKGNKHLKIPMNTKMYNFFKDKIYESDEYIFINPRTNKPFTYTGLNDEWTKTKRLAKIEDFRFHDLRHTFGTRLAQKGVPVNIIKELLGHSDISTTMRYLHFAQEQLVNAVEQL